MQQGIKYESEGEIAESFETGHNFLADVRSKPFKSGWKGFDQMLDFAGQSNRVFIRGAAEGVPICYLKGGPGSAPLSSGQKRYWDPSQQRVVLSSWRGCGEAEPLGSFENNTTHQLVEDIEVMRKAAGVKAMLLAGYCWGPTVAFKYAAKYPERTLGIVAMLPYLARQADIEYGFGTTGIARCYPEAYQEFTAGIRPGVQNLFEHYAAALCQDLRSPEAISAYVRWKNWEFASSGDLTRITIDSVNPADKQTLAEIAGERINVHYLRNGYFLPIDGVVSCLPAVNALTRQGKPVAYVATELDPVMAPDHLRVLQAGLPDVSRIIVRNANWHWISPTNPNGQSNETVEQPFAAMVQKAVRVIRERQFVYQ